MSLSDKSLSLLKRDLFLFGTNLITGAIVARRLGPTALGWWVILQMIPAYAEGFGRLQWDYASIYVLGRKDHGVRDVVMTLNLAALVMSSIIVALVLWQFEAVYYLLFANSEDDVRFFMTLILVQIPLQFLFLNYSYLLLYQEDIRAYNLMVLLRALLASVLGIAGLVVFDLGLIAVVGASLLSVAGGFVYGASQLRLTGPPARWLNLRLIRDLSSYGGLLYVTGMLSQVNQYVTRSILAFTLPPAQVAYFAMAQNQGQLLNRIPTALNSLLYSRISKLDSGDGAAQLAARAFRVVLLVLLVLGAALFVVISPVIELLYGAPFLAAVLPFRIMIAGLVLGGATTVINQYFTGIGRADICTKLALVPLVVQVPVALFLIPTMGLAGAAVALLVSLLASSAVQLGAFVMVAGSISWRDLIIGWSDVRELSAFLRSRWA